MALTSGTSQRNYGPRGTIIKLINDLWIFLFSSQASLILGKQCLMLWDKQLVMFVKVSLTLNQYGWKRWWFVYVCLKTELCRLRQADRANWLYKVTFLKISGSFLRELNVASVADAIGTHPCGTLCLRHVCSHANHLSTQCDDCAPEHIKRASTKMSSGSFVKEKKNTCISK